MASCKHLFGLANMGDGDVCTVADKLDGDGDDVVEIMTASRLAELCAMSDDHAARGTMGARKVASICAMIEECHPAGDVEESRGRKGGRPRRRVNCTSTRCYRQIGRISKGGFGLVVKAEQRDTGQTVAMKTLRAPDAGALLREACYLAACHGHPYLVGLHGVARNPRTEQYCLVMEYVGPSLRDALDEYVKRHGRAYPEATVRRIMHQLLRGVKAMHDRRIIHRDIKTDNILVGEDGDVVKICDFGLAMSTEAEPPYEKAGTAPYMAPEMLLEKPDYDELVDMWSLGCVMAELLSGGEPFEGKGLKDHLHEIFAVLGVPGKKARKAFKSKTKLLAYVVRQWQQQEQHAGDQLRELLPEKLLSRDGFNVLKGLLTFNPNKRLTAAAALKHRWFAGAAVDDASKSGAAALLRKTALSIFGFVISAWALLRLSISAMAGIGAEYINAQGLEIALHRCYTPFGP
ncbi:hypothetical protein E2562_038729 [Oryza meyeriana var. granulata]|uniref:[RNA-polymerase]-subunit kinase n=1 Tax=Oryza meyeriana var. granulata TaxID=110450 RepID=A0A6G1DU80_9ORYZ|nr:hypothetical protein E2562_038724 [Oryza meyeriana var. granulata]KAF0915762.1 hypothetical protein E2562_038729 [Oryza meyeriana var. granulata]